jgi:histidine ammonia-lyase
VDEGLFFKPFTRIQMTITNNLLLLDGETLTIADIVKAGRKPDIKLEIVPEKWEKITKSRALVDKWAEEEQVIYGINTSCGGLVNYLLPRENDREFQQNLIRAVTTQVGDHLPDELVRATMIARANSLCRGYSGIKPENLRIYLAIIG